MSHKVAITVSQIISLIECKDCGPGSYTTSTNRMGYFVVV